MNNYSSSDEASMDGDVSDWSDVSEEAVDLLTQADQEEVTIHPGRPKNPPIQIELIPTYVPINDVSGAYDAVMTQCARNSVATENKGDFTEFFICSQVVVQWTT
uniref:Uncharacterized protein n=1 Tax=Ditylenchus dipsaci TaxID=166011 RepID=A0A915DC11_9BILA